MIFKKRKKLITHSGSFHADDVFACATLALYLEQQKQPYSITRTRDEKLIAQGDYVFDVGGIYDPDQNRFDHHQSGGAGKRDNGIPYAAFGLVWKKFGPRLCTNPDIVRDLDRRLAQPIDAIDNGMTITEPVECGLYDYGIHGIVSAYQNTWKEALDAQCQKQNFMSLVDFFKSVIKREIDRSQHHMDMVTMIQEHYDKAERKDIIEIPYHITINALMQVMDQYKEVIYIVCRSNTNWKVLAVRKDMCTFDNRKPLPSEWAGRRTKDLQDITGVPDALFCHNALFLGVAESKEGAWKLAELAIKN